MSTGRTEDNVSPSPPDDKEYRVGTPDEVVRAFAFAGGGFDTVMQLGVAHAMLVSKHPAPDLIVGISAGAVNAVTVAEILQAGKGLEGGCVREAQVTRFRKLLNEYQEWPPALLRSILPDAYEVNFSEGLSPIELPIHHQAERDKRAQAFRAKAGLIQLFNGVLRIGVTFGTVTRFVRLLLGLSQAAEIRNPRKRGWEKFRLIWGIWRLAGLNLHKVTPQVQMMVLRVLSEWWRRKRRPSERDCKELLRGAKEAQHIIFVRWRSVLKAAAYYIIGYPALMLLWLSAGLVLFGALVVWAVRLGGAFQWIWNRRKRHPRANGFSGLWNAILATYELDKDLGDAHFLEESFVRLFDPNYYGKAENGRTHMDRIVDHALQHDYASPVGEPLPRPDRIVRRRLCEYAKGTSGIRVVPIAANVATGELEAIPQDTPVVDALKAATAVVPLFRAVKLDGVPYIDGLNISNEPTLALMDILRQKLDPKVSRVEIYPVTPFPLGQEILPKTCTSSTSLVDVALRAIQLRRYRDSTLERRIVGLYNELIPDGKSVIEIGEKKYVKASIHPIEVDEALELNERIVRTSRDDERRRLILTAVADGCRATLQAMFSKEIKAAPETSKGFLQCKALIGSNALPGTGAEKGPGVPEVCKYCAARGSNQEIRTQTLCSSRECAERPDPNATHSEQIGKNPCAAGTKEITPHQEISAHTYELLRLKERRLGHDPEDLRKAEYQARHNSQWPRNRTDKNSRAVENRPLVSVLFSGGVFRGVFQVGVLNALNELNLKPDIVAGSSVGSIMAALGAEVFCQDSNEKRSAQIARLAATFLGLDRLILTDRFADFLRRFTLRAAQANFSPRDADGIFRRYDAGFARRHNRRLRRVVAGLERLFYVSPYELNKLVRASRLRRRDEVHRLLRKNIQELLDRHGVGLELLGSEPLSLLINQHIVEVHPGLQVKRGEELPFDLFENHGIRLLATTTNLQLGHLDILGQASPEPVFLVDGLLASCAFPAVFRPRWSWELYRGARPQTPFIDGGVMDNLPLDAVVHEMNAPGNRIKKRPTFEGKPAPHLLFAASLEANVGTISRSEANKVASHWPQLWQRARDLSYNQKIDLFAQVQRDLREIYQHCEKNGTTKSWEPLDIEVIAVKPEWLCGTFAMHPMLGFRRWKQAASIAHGCASTVARFALVKEANWLKAWGVAPDHRDKFDMSTIKMVDEKTGQIKLTPKGNGDGTCWFRNVQCPFSAKELKATGLSEVTCRELENIYRLCGKVETHQPAG